MPLQNPARWPTIDGLEELRFGIAERQILICFADHLPKSGKHRGQPEIRTSEEANQWS